MKYFSIRQSDDQTTGTAWPAQAPPWHLLEVPTRLQIPLVAKAATGRIAHRPAGTIVSKGENLCDVGFAGSPAALAPTSGRIIGSSQVQLLNGSIVPAVDVEADFEDRSHAGESHDVQHAQAQHEQIEEVQTAGPANLAQWIDRLGNAGVWAERPASPDLLAQLHRALRQPIDTILCNLLDDEPAMRLNGVLAARSGPLLLAGISLLARLTEARQVSLVIEAGSPGKWWLPLRRLARKARFDVVPILNDYPQGNPTLLLHAMLKRRLKPGRSPGDQRVFMLDAAAAIAIGRCASRGQSMLRVPLALRDHTRRRTHFLIAPVGISLREVLKQCDIPADGMTLRRGALLQQNDVSIDAIIAGGELTVHVMPHQVAALPDPCIRCAWCVESCPTRVQPAGLLEAAQRGDLELARQYGLDSCIECGVCSYVCPSHLPLLQAIRILKQKSGKMEVAEIPRDRDDRR